MTELQTLHEAVVAEEEIDHLGHMNVRFYHDKAMRASEALAGAHGLGPDACRQHGGTLELRDAFTRHYREQLVGAPLAVRGGVLEVRGSALRLYHELVNTERDELAATHVHLLELCDAATRAPLPLPELVAQSAGAGVVAWPEHGRPRTLDLDRVPELGLADARARGIAFRQERTIDAESCGPDGHFPAHRYQELFWGGEPARPGVTIGPILRDLPDGGKLGWATLESRGVLRALPRAGTRIQSFGAEVEIAAKTTTRHMWVFDLEREALVATSSIVNLAFDVTRRGAVEIPPDVRERFEELHHPDLR